jgi:hypothetical protein
LQAAYLISGRWLNLLVDFYCAQVDLQKANLLPIPQLISSDKTTRQSRMLQQRRRSKLRSTR